MSLLALGVRVLRFRGDFGTCRIINKHAATAKECEPVWIVCFRRVSLYGSVLPPRKRETWRGKMAELKGPARL